MRELFLIPAPEFPNIYASMNRDMIAERMIEVEISPYYWWWYALTLNKAYIECCKAEGSDDLELCRVYEYFGDVRYRGSSHIAFKDWWTEIIQLKNDDPIHINSSYKKKAVSRGELLFAEPMSNGRIHQLNNPVKVAKAAESDDHIVITIPTNLSKKYVDEQVTRVLNKFHPAFQDVSIRDLKKSKALFPMKTAAQVDVLRLHFQVYEMRTRTDEEDSLFKMTNPEIAKELGVSVSSGDEQTDKLFNQAEQDRRNGVQVSKYFKKAKDTIENVGKGVFP